VETVRALLEVGTLWDRNCAAEVPAEVEAFRSDHIAGGGIGWGGDATQRGNIGRSVPIRSCATAAVMLRPSRVQTIGQQCASRQLAGMLIFRMPGSGNGQPPGVTRLSASHSSRVIEAAAFMRWGRGTSSGLESGRCA
jgi:hypothetical protein